jgi:hypothetical protein
MQKITKETEIEFAFDQLIKFGAFGWAYFICIIRRDTHLFYDLTLRAQAGERKTSDSSFINREFIDSLYSGTVELQKWAEQQW